MGMDITPKTAPKGKMINAKGTDYYLFEMGSGNPVFFLHGGGPGCTGWSDFGVVLPLFAKHKRCIVPDLLQYGKSDKAIIKGPMWDHHAGSMVELMDELGIERADFVCNSWGGCLLYTSPSPRDRTRSRMPSSA